MREINHLSDLPDSELDAAALAKIPSGFKRLDSAPGVELYANDPDYVVSVDLSRGAKLNLLAGDLFDRGKKSVYGGPDPDFKRMSADQALLKERKLLPDTIGVLNGEFFSNLPKSEVPLAFAFKQDAKVLSEGFADRSKHAGKRLTLILGDAYAKIAPFDNNDINSFANIKEDQAVVSLSPSVNIDGSAAKKVGRTFLGLVDPDSDGKSKRALIFVSSASTEQHAEDTLKQFGAGPVIMFDGGDSSQLLFESHHYVHTSRTLPQFIAIIPAKDAVPDQVVDKK